MRSHVELIRDEINVREVAVRHDESSLVDLSVRPDYRTARTQAWCPRAGTAAAELGGISGADVERLQHGERLTIAGIEVGIDDVVVQRMPRPGTVVASEGELSVALDWSSTRTWYRKAWHVRWSAGCNSFAVMPGST